MIRRFLLLSTFLLPITLLAQVRTNAHNSSDVVIAKSQTNQRLMCNEAGTVTVSRPPGFTQDIEFLCAGDSLRIDHAGDQDLSGDPDGTTAPGIVYLFYSDMPNAANDGPDLGTITADPNIILDGTGFPIADGEDVTDEFGNGFFVNSQMVRDGFDGGFIPREVYLAPATIDDHSNLAWEGNPVGSCVDVNTDEAFRLVLLNPIEVVNPTINGCSGSFTIQGGLPEFDNTDVYNSINIENTADRMITATVTANGTTATHNSVVQFVATVPGEYEIIVTDDKGCPGSAIVDLTSTCTNAGLSVGIISEPLGCGTALGQISVALAGGVTPYTLTISRNGSALPNFPQAISSPQTYNLPLSQAGNYTVQVTDSSGTPQNFTENLQIFDLDDFGLNVNVLNQVNCRDEMTGQLAVEITDPTGAVVSNPGPEFEFLWNNGNTNDTITDVLPGAYNVMVKFMGEDLCVVPNASLNNPAELGLSTVPLITPPDCPGDNGRLEILPTGGTPFAVGGSYQVDWFLVVESDGSLDPVAGGRDETIYEGAESRYLAIVTDANNCTFTTDTLSIVNPAAITIAFQDSLPTSCAVGNPEDGAVTVLASGGGSNDYIFSWMNPMGETSGGFAASHRATALVAGFNVVTVTDRNGCMAVDSVSIPAPPAITFDSIRTTSTSCFGGSDGTAFVRATGGTGTYTYAWDSSDSGALISGLSSGTYTVTATDTNNCPSVPFVVNVNQPDSMQVFIDNFIGISCNAEADGVIELGILGGNTGAYTFNWNTGNPADTTSIITGLSQGTYAVTVTDARGCQDTTSTILSQPDPVEAVFAIDSIMCNGTSTLIAVDTAFGGIGGPYVYSVDGFNFQPINTPIPVGAGTYNLIVRDINDCEYFEPYVLGEPAPLQVELSGVSINTFGIGIPELLVIDTDQSPNATEIELGDSVRLDLVTLGVQGGIDSIAWTTSPLGFPLCPTADCTEVGFFSTDDVLASVVVVDEMGCEGSAQLFVEVDRNRKLYIPNAFNPDSNEFDNRLFKVFAGQGVTEVVDMKVYNRWGALVYGAANFDPKVNDNIGWDGTFRGKRVNPDVFVYVVRVLFDDGIELTYRGSVTLLY